MFRKTMAALFRRLATRRHGYERIARREEEVEDYEPVLLEAEGLGPEALEERGDRFMARGHRRGSSRWFVSFCRHQTSIAIADDFREAALSYILAKKWRKAATAYGNQAVYALKGGLPHDCLDAASALLSSAICYTKILHKDEGEAAAIKCALHKAIALFIKGNELRLAATCCRELAGYYADQKDWHNAVHFYDKAWDYYSSTPNGDPQNADYCNARACLIRLIHLKARSQVRACSQVAHRSDR